jgi:hypothetical protein
MTDPTNPTEPREATEPAEPQAHGRSATWRPPREGDSNVAAIVVGLILVGIGGWYFLEQTLGIRMPRISWRDVWPVALIVLGVFVIVRSQTRRG